MINVTHKISTLVEHVTTLVIEFYTPTNALLYTIKY